MANHHSFLQSTGASGGYLGVSSGSLSKVDSHRGLVRNTPVVTTDVGDLPYEMDGDVRVFRLTAHVFSNRLLRIKRSMSGASTAPRPARPSRSRRTIRSG
jgi:hypothetical protein